MTMNNSRRCVECSTIVGAIMMVAPFVKVLLKR